MAEVAAVDASPLIFLGRSGRLALLRLAAPRIVVTPEVLAEVSRGSDDSLMKAVRERSWLELEVSLSIPETIQSWGLGPGESSVLAWCSGVHEAEAILDDLAARRCAAELGIPYRGTLGLVLVAKQRGVIPAARPLLEQLRRDGMYLSDSVVARALSRIGE